MALFRLPCQPQDKTSSSVVHFLSHQLSQFCSTPNAQHCCLSCAQCWQADQSHYSTLLLNLNIKASHHCLNIKATNPFPRWPCQVEYTQCPLWLLVVNLALPRPKANLDPISIELGVNLSQGMLDTVLEVSFTADDRHVVAAGGDKALRMWNIQSGRERHTLTGHTAKVPSQGSYPEAKFGMLRMLQS